MADCNVADLNIPRQPVKVLSAPIFVQSEKYISSLLSASHHEMDDNQHLIPCQFYFP